MARVTVVGWGLLCSILLAARSAPAGEPKAPAKEKKTKAPDEPWVDVEPFSVDPKEMLRVAEAAEAPAGTDVVILYEQGRLTLADDGRAKYEHYMIYRVLTPDGVSQWDSLAIGWSPWYENRPELRARVITAGGGVHELDAKTIDDAPARETTSGTFTDSRRLQAPLPAVGVGAVVERMTTVEDARPYFEGGSSYRWQFGGWVPVRRSRYTVDASEKLPLAWEVRGTKLKPRTTRAGGRVKHVFEVAGMAAFEEREPGVPSDVFVRPHLWVATGKSWKDVAGKYAKVVEKRITDGVDVPVEELTGGAKDRETVVANTLAWLHKNVRYTGIEFGEASIVPWTPKEVLARKFGDCKDQASVLVAALRKAGVSASLVLVNTGFSEDPTSLPGLGIFDHAIVRVAGEPAIWIDPTEELARAGELPTWDQGRLALIVDAKTNGLVRTPAPRAAEDRIAELNEITLAEDGGARVRVVVETRGVTERNVRRWFADTEAKEVRKWFEEITRRDYSGKLDRWSSSDPSNLSKPLVYEWTIDAAEAYFTTSEDRVSVAISTRQLIDALPEDLRTKPEDGAKPRVNDYALVNPFTYEVRFAITPPPGYVTPTLPPAETTPLGPLSLTRAYAQADGVVTATLRLEVGKSRLTSAEFTALRDAAVRELEAPPAQLTFEQLGMAHVAAGRILEGIAELRKLIALHPKEALHHAQLSKAYLVAGMGRAARAEAREAVKLEPKSDTAWWALATALEHDEQGRLHHPGHDRKGAIAAYRKARELLPDGTWHMFNLARLLEVNEQGISFAPGADLDGAIAEYREMVDKHNRTDMKIDLLRALFWRDRHDEAIDLAHEMQPTPERDGLLVAAVTLKSGSAAGIREAGALASVEARRGALDAASGLVAVLRRYPEAAALLDHVVSADPRANVRARLAQLRVMTKYDPQAKIGDPAELARRVNVVLMSSALVGEAANLKPLLAGEARTDDMAAFAAGMLAGVARAGATRLVRDLPSRDMFVDVTFSFTECKNVDSDGDAAWRIECANSETAGKGTAVYVVREGKNFRLLALGGGAGLGRRAFALSSKGKEDAARKLLEWAASDMAEPDTGDPLSGRLLKRLWQKGTQRKGEALRIAAAVQATEGVDPPRAALELLSACGEKSDADATICRAALASAYVRAKRWKDLLPLTARLAKDHPDSEVAFQLHALALRGTGAGKELLEHAAARLARFPDEYHLHDMIADAHAAAGDFAAARAAYDQGLKADDRSPYLLNAASWFSLVDGVDPAEALARVERAVRLQRSFAILNTLAALRAVAGNPYEAYQSWQESLRPGASALDDEDWLAYGLIAEAYQLDEDALASYRRIPKGDDAERPGSNYYLASRRIKAIEARIKAAGKNK